MSKNILFIMFDQLRFDYLGLRGSSSFAYASYRLAGLPRAALYQRLCAIAGLRRVSDVLLHRALCLLPWRGMERRALEGRRDHPWRSFA